MNFLAIAALLSQSSATTCPTCDFEGGNPVISLPCDENIPTYSCGYDVWGNTNDCVCNCEGLYGADCKSIFMDATNNQTIAGTCNFDAPAPVQQQGFCVYTHIDDGHWSDMNDGGNGERTCDAMTSDDGLAFHMDGFRNWRVTHSMSSNGPGDFSSGWNGRLTFCCHSRTTELTFPAGSYCLAEQEYGCPSGFTKHSSPLYYGGDDDYINENDRQTTSGVNGLKIEGGGVNEGRVNEGGGNRGYNLLQGAFCCRNDGNVGTPMTLPFSTSDPRGFQMLRMGATCQAVTGKTSSAESITVDFRTYTGAYDISEGISALASAGLALSITGDKVTYNTCRYH